MTTETKQATHTPVPWHIEEDGDALWIHDALNATIADVPPSMVMMDGGDYELTDEDRANAEFIVRACNAHDDLLAACEQALAYFAVIEKANRGKTWPAHSEKVNADIMRAAIAKATGGQP